MIILLLGVFLLSGLSTLIYQVLWMRLLTQVFGSTVYAVSTVVTVFMAGLAIGSLYAGRNADKWASNGSLLKRYAQIEVLIALSCLATPLLFANLDVIYSYVYAIADVNFTLFSLLRLLLSFLILVIPTTLMGATLPVISRIIVREEATLGRYMGLLYGLNTLGAVCGVLLTAFILLPLLGMQHTLYAAVAINVLIGGLCYGAAKNKMSVEWEGTVTPAVQEIFVEDIERPAPLKLRYIISRQPLVVWAFAFSGFAALAYEVIWFRILGLIIGNTVYAFAVMLSVYLLGIALGSYCLSRVVDRIKSPVQWLAQIQLAIGLSVVLLTPLFGQMPMLFMALVEQMGTQFWQMQSINFIVTACVLLLPTMLMGATFPLVIKILVPGVSQIAQTVGSLYALNTLGGVIGSLLAGFVLIPYLGMQNSVGIVAMINIVLGCFLLWHSPDRKTRYRQSLMVWVMTIFVVFLALFVIIAAPPWTKNLMTSGVYFNVFRYIDSFKQGQLQQVLEQEKSLIYYKEGLTGTVSVNKVGEHLALAINGKVTAAVPGNVFTNVMFGSVPLLLHEQPEDVLLVGLASGVSLDAMLQFPLQTVDVVEISPEVVEANPLFSRYNHDALKDARVNLIIDDGRSYLSYAAKLYDVIVSMPAVPLSSGVANLFTVEYYQAMAGRLRAKGIAMVWYPTYGNTLDDLKIAIRSFKQAFPYAMVWQYDVENIMLIGTLQPWQLDTQRLASRLLIPAVGARLQDFSVGTVEAIVGGLTISSDALAGFVGKGAINSDDHPVLEFAAPRLIFATTAVGNYNSLVRYAPHVRVPDLLRPDDEGLYFSFMRLHSSLPEEWVLHFAGYNIRSREVNENVSSVSLMVDRGILPVVEWYNREAGLWLRLRTRQAESTERLEYMQRRPYLQAEKEGVWVSSGLDSIDNQRLDWAVTRQGEQLNLTLTWLCPSKDRLYIIDVPNVLDLLKPVTQLVDQISQAFNCR